MCIVFRAVHAVLCKLYRLHYTYIGNRPDTLGCRWNYTSKKNVWYAGRMFCDPKPNLGMNTSQTLHQTVSVVFCLPCLLIHIKLKLRIALTSQLVCWQVQCLLGELCLQSFMKGFWNLRKNKTGNELNRGPWVDFTGVLPLTVWIGQCSILLDDLVLHCKLNQIMLF